MNLCLRYTKNETEALEVLNTGFYKVYKNIHRYNAAKATLYTWIRTIIINSCLDFIKAKQVNPKQESWTRRPMYMCRLLLFQRCLPSEILQLVRQLPPATQAVFNLYVMEGYNHAK